MNQPPLAVRIVQDAELLGPTDDNKAVGIRFKAHADVIDLAFRLGDVQKLIAGLLSMTQEAATRAAIGAAQAPPARVQEVPIQARGYAPAEHGGQPLLVVDLGVMQMVFALPGKRADPAH